jgi:hypothetical protein
MVKFFVLQLFTFRCKVCRRAEVVLPRSSKTEATFFLFYVQDRDFTTLSPAAEQMVDSLGAKIKWSNLSRKCMNERFSVYILLNI